MKELAASNEASLPTQRKKEERFRVAYGIREILLGALGKQRLFRSYKRIGGGIAVAQRPVELG